MPGAGVQRNPDWTEEELTIALDFYVRSKTESDEWIDEEAERISDLLSNLGIHPQEKCNEEFRSAEGVKRRFRYFKSLESGAPIKSRRVYRQVWDKYAKAQDELEAGVKQILIGSKQNQEKLGSLRDFFEKTSAEYPVYLAQEKVNSAAEAYKLVVTRIPRLLRSILGPKGDRYIVEGSTGIGRITVAPWVAVFDKSVTTSATSGFYLVYLFSTNLNRLYLCIGFGATQFTDAFGEGKKSKQKLREAVQKVRPLFVDVLPEKVLDNVIDLSSEKSPRHKGYENATIYCLDKYQVDSMPSDKLLASHLFEAVNIYRTMADDPLMPSVEDLIISASTDTSGGSAREVSLIDFIPRKAQKKGIAQGKHAPHRRSTQSAKVGRAGEEAVVRAEIKKLQDCGQGHLVEKIQRHYENAEYPGWDITSFDDVGEELFIEVKATVGKSISSVELTRNEWEAANRAEYKESYRIYLVIEALSENPRIEVLRNPARYVESGDLNVAASVFELSLVAK